MTCGSRFFRIEPAWISADRERDHGLAEAGRPYPEKARTGLGWAGRGVKKTDAVPQRAAMGCRDFSVEM